MVLDVTALMHISLMRGLKPNTSISSSSLAFLKKAVQRILAKVTSPLKWAMGYGCLREEQRVIVQAGARTCLLCYPKRFFYGVLLEIMKRIAVTSKNLILT